MVPMSRRRQRRWMDAMPPFSCCFHQTEGTSSCHPRLRLPAAQTQPGDHEPNRQETQDEAGTLQPRAFLPADLPTTANPPPIA